ncbi:myrosinase 1-like isoform X2 [Periplaneta americana]|uniref:myrosinase 1-like isoform X2 n=1 Tax=Periplaneta americana TaxID=6978 RepID=UPI0037E83BA0
MLVATLLLLANSVAQNAALDVRFPDGFMFGAATSAYQAEGFWDRDGKGPSVWDTFMHEYSYLIPNNSNGDDSAESYCKYKEDIQALKDMGMQFYRFSISWPRIMPTGLSNVINQKGIRFYSELIDEVIKNGITPMVTMHHWDLPQSLQDLGGWTNEVIAEYFEDYARVLFSNYGDRVKWWITMNGPRLFWDGYEGSSAILPFAPYVNGTGIAPYLEGHTMLKAHAKVYHLYKNEFQKTQQGKISISASLTWFDPENVNSSAHIAAAERMFDFCNNWFLHPIYSKEGDYPAIMKDRIGNLSRAYGLAKSRLPAFKTEEINYIKGTADFAALNLHSTLLVNDKEDGEVPSTSHDVRASIATKLRGIPQESFETLSPRGIRNAMNMFKQKYGDWSIFITESGFADSGGVDDKIRVKYLGEEIRFIPRGFRQPCKNSHT